MADCSFCKIVRGDLPSIKIYENDYVFVFAPLKETIIGKGHMLVIPKKHYANIYEINEKNLLEIMKAIRFIGNRIKDKINADGLNIIHASGKSAQQSVFHFHIHLIPRYKNDGLDTWPKTGYKSKNPLKYYDIIKNCLK